MTSNYNADDLLDLIADLEVLKDLAEGRGYIEDGQIGGALKAQVWESTARFLRGSIRIAKKLQGDLEAPSFESPGGSFQKAANLALSRKSVLERIRDRTRPDRPDSPTSEFILKRIREEVVNSLSLEQTSGPAPRPILEDPERSPTPIRPEALRAANKLMEELYGMGWQTPARAPSGAGDTEKAAVVQKRIGYRDEKAAIIDSEIAPALNGAQESLDRIFKMAAPYVPIKGDKGCPYGTPPNSLLTDIHKEALTALGALNKV